MFAQLMLETFWHTQEEQSLSQEKEKKKTNGIYLLKQIEGLWWFVI